MAFLDNVPTRDEWEIVIDSQRVIEGQKPELTVHPTLAKYITASWINFLSDKKNNWEIYRTLPLILISLSLFIYIKTIYYTILHLKKCYEYERHTIFFYTNVCKIYN